MITKINISTELKQADKKIFDKIVFDGTSPSPIDSRDFTPAMVTAVEREFPEEYEAPETEVFDQGSIGSCVAHSCATALAQGDEVNSQKHNEYSRGYIYGNRAATDTKSEGMYMRQALKQLNKCGDVLYTDFPYNKTYPEVAELIEKDKENLAKKAAPYKILNYYRCYTDEDIKTAIMDKGGCLICVPVYTDFARNLSRTKTNKLRGYHAMIIVGWTKEGQWIVQNSWGKYWGYGGKLIMDADYPVDEYWGITVSNGEITPTPKKSLWQRFIEWLKKLLKKK